MSDILGFLLDGIGQAKISRGLQAIPFLVTV